MRFDTCDTVWGTGYGGKEKIVLAESNKQDWEIQSPEITNLIS